MNSLKLKGEYALKELVNKLKKHKKLSFFLVYTIIFLLIILIIYSFFRYNNRSLVYLGDSFKQHLKAFIYVSEWYKEIIKNIFINHTFKVSTYNLSLGLGSDIITTLHYYSIGDPLTLFGIICPNDKLTYMYQFLMIFRIYLSGITFSLYCFNKKKYETGAILSGTLIYAFSSYSLYAAIQHPFFVNVCIYYPLLLLGTDRIFDGYSPIPFILSVFISAISNFYFFYMLVLFEVLYCILKVVTTYSLEDYKEVGILVLRFIIYGTIGVLLSAIIFLPVVIAYLGDYRAASSYSYSLFYEFYVYKRLISEFVLSYTDAPKWSYMGYGMITIIALFLLFNKKGNDKYKMTFIVLILFTCISYFGSLANGLSYSTNRWIWVLNMLIGYIYVVCYERFFNLSRFDVIGSTVVVMVYFLICFKIDYSKGDNLAYSSLVALVSIILLYLMSERKLKMAGQIILIGAIVISICINKYFNYSLDESTLLSSYIDQVDVLEYLAYNDAAAISEYSDDDVVRFGSYGSSYGAVTTNSGLLYNLSSIGSYWSLSNGYVSEFIDEMNMRFYYSNNYQNFDERSYITALSSVNYYVVNNTFENSSKYKPYGYSYVGTTEYEYDFFIVEDENDILESLGDEQAENFKDVEDLVDELLQDSQKRQYDVYENKYALPLGYTYSTYISEEDYEEMSSTEKQEAMMQGIVLADYESDDYKETKVEYSEEEIDYTITFDSLDISMNDNSFFVTAENQSVTLEFEGLENCETYVYFENISFELTNPVDLYSDDESVDPYNLYNEEDLTTHEYNYLKHVNRNFHASYDVNLTIQSYTDNEMMTEKEIKLANEGYSFYNGKDDYLVNMCYSKNGRTSITITFPEAGVYSFDDLKIICQPMDDYKELISDLSEDVLENVEYSGTIEGTIDTITGELSLKKDKILCMSIPYSEGWTCYVDGEKVEILRANTMYMAIEVEKGDHEIELRYSTPGYTIGALCSGLGIVLFTFTILNDKKILGKRQ